MIDNWIVEQDGKTVATLLGAELISAQLNFDLNLVGKKLKSSLIKSKSVVDRITLRLSFPNHVKIKAEGKSLFRLISFRSYWIDVFEFEARVVSLSDNECCLCVLGFICRSVKSKRSFNKLKS